MSLKPPKGLKKGKAKPLTNCCRDIRICSPNKLGEVVSGYFDYGDYRDKVETVMVIKESKPFNMNKTIVVELNKQGINNKKEVMEIDVREKYQIVLRKVYNGITLEQKEDEFFICMRDNGFEFIYNNIHYEAKDGNVRVLTKQDKQ